jgi:hypothetical protein
MISIVCVYNSEKLLEENLVESLKTQSKTFELILVDNRYREFESAAKALNYCGNKANGKYIMFVHQDVILCSKYLLEQIENTLDNTADLGVAGVTGIDREGGQVGFIMDTDFFWGKPVFEPKLAQVLDEEVLIVPQEVFSKLKFDCDVFDGWHCYGSDYSLQVKEKLGLNAYVIPAFIHHNSPSDNVTDLPKYYQRLLEKYAQKYPGLYTTSTTLNVRTRLIIQPYINFYKLIFPPFTDFLTREIEGCKTVLNLACGNKMPCSQFCSYNCSVKGIELFSAYSPFLKKFYEYTYSDIAKTNFKEKSFDAVLILNVLEYVTKGEGVEIIEKAEKWANKRIVLSVANGIRKPKNKDGNLMGNRTLWDIHDLKAMGYTIYGLDWKKMYYDAAFEKMRAMSFPSRIFSQITSDLSKEIIRHFPKNAPYLLCTKKLTS